MNLINFIVAIIGHGCLSRDTDYEKLLVSLATQQSKYYILNIQTQVESSKVKVHKHHMRKW